MASVKEVFIKVREKLSPPGVWTQWSFARDVDGKPVGVVAPEACKWCLLGAACAVDAEAVFVSHTDYPMESEASAALRAHLNGGDPAWRIGTISAAKWNDEKGRTQEEVLALLDSFIQKL